MKQIIINVAPGSKLDRLVQQLLFDSGFKWVYSSPRAFFFDHSGTIYAKQKDGEKKLANNGFVARPDINAATEMGKLIELLEAPQEVIIEDLARAKNGSGPTYRGEISANGETLVVGCSIIWFAKVEEVYLKMKEWRS